MVIRRPLCHRSDAGAPCFSAAARPRIRAAAGGRYPVSRAAVDEPTSTNGTGPSPVSSPPPARRHHPPCCRGLVARPGEPHEIAAARGGSAPFLTRPNCVRHGPGAGGAPARVAKGSRRPQVRRMNDRVNPPEPVRAGRCGQRRPDPHRHGDRRRRPGRAVRGVRGRPAQHAVPPGRQSRPAGRPVRRALSGQADLRYPGGAALHRPGADRPAAAADPAVRAGACT